MKNLQNEDKEQIKSYCAKMGEAESIANGKLRINHFGKKYTIQTKLKLKEGRSIEKLETSIKGFNNYGVTELGLTKLKEQNLTFSFEFLLS